MIQLQNLCKFYPTTRGRNVVLDNISVNIPKGKNLGILGRNGAGKSTLLRLLGGSELPSSGRIVRNATVSWPIGFSGGFHGSLTGRENLRFICRIYAANINKVTAFVEEFSGLGDYMEMPLNTYSSGMKAKLAFGLSMAIEFDFYLIDEVTAVGDARFKRKSKEEFDRRKDHSNLIIVSHSIPTIREHCDVCMILENGKLRKFEELEEAIAYYQAMN